MPTQSPPTHRRRRLRQAAAALAVIGLGTVLLDWNVLRRPLEYVISGRLEREIRINGPLSVHLWSLHPSLSAEEVELANAPGGKAPHLARVGRLQITLNLSESLKGKWVLDGMELDRADVQLEEDATGKGNWLLGRQGDEAPVAVRYGKIRIRDGTLGLVLPARKVDLKLRLTSDEDKERLNVTVAGRWAGEAVAISGRADVMQGLLYGSQPYSVDARGSIGPTRFNVSGSAGDVAQLDGLDIRFTLSGQSLAGLFPLTGVPLPATPPYRIAGRLVRTGPSWQFQDIDGKVGSSDVSGHLSIDRSTTPQALAGKLRSRHLDLSDLSGFIGARKHSGQEIAPRPGKVLPSRPLGFEKIAAANVDLDFVVDDFRNTGLPLDSAQGRLTIVDRQVKLSPLKLGLAKGVADGSLQLDTRKQPASATLDMRATRLQLRELLPDTNSRRFTSGVLGGHATLAMRGQSVAELLASANGTLALAMTGGSTDRLLVRLANLDVANSLVSWLSGGQREDIRCIIADMEATNGVLKPRALILDTARTRVRGNGQISLRDETLDLHLRTEAKDTSLLALRGPLYLGGSFADPVVRPEPLPLSSRIAGAVALGMIAPPLALLPLIETGGAEHSPCSTTLGVSPRKAAPRGR